MHTAPLCDGARHDGGGGGGEGELKEEGDEYGSHVWSHLLTSGNNWSHLKEEGDEDGPHVVAGSIDEPRAASHGAEGHEAVRQAS